MAAIHTFPDQPELHLKKIREFFTDKGLLTSVTVDRMSDRASEAGIKLGPYLEKAGLITAEELADALATIYQCRKIFDFAKYSYHPMLLRSIPMDLAVEHTIFPLKMENGLLGVAVLDPTIKDVLESIATRINVKVVPFVSTRNDINRAIARHYMGRKMDIVREKSILLVEDDSFTATVVSDILKKHGYTVYTSPDGMEAFKNIFTQNPRLVITDKVMPKLNGYEFLHTIRNVPEFKYTPVILMTANASADEEKLAFEKGFFDLILKPIKEISLITRVRRAMENPAGLYAQGA